METCTRFVVFFVLQAYHLIQPVSICKKHCNFILREFDSQLSDYRKTQRAIGLFSNLFNVNTVANVSDNKQYIVQL
jgi:hypothetical protein